MPPQLSTNQGFLSHDSLSSQRRAGASDDQIAKLIARRDPKFASELDNIRIRASQFSNADRAVSAFLNYKVYGDATYAPEADEPTGIFQRRGEALRPAIEQAGSNPAQIPELALNAAGQTAGAIGELGFEALKSVTPDFIEKPLGRAVQAGVGAVMDSPLGAPIQKGIEQYGQFKEEHPRAARNVEAVGNITSLLPAEKALGLGLRGAKAGLVAAGEALEESGEAAIKAQKSKFAQQLVMPELSKKGMTDEIDSFRTVNEGGILKGREVLPTKREIEVAQTVEKIPELDPRKTALQNRDAINTQIQRVATGLDEAFLESDPIISEKEMRTRFRDARNRRESKIIFASDAQAEKLWDQLEETYFDSLNSRKKKASSAWEARKEFYRLAEDSGVNFDKMNLKTEITEVMGDVVNNYIEDQMRRTGHTFLPEMREMNNLYIARKNIAPKAAGEASTAIGRWVQKVQQRTRLSKGTLVALSSMGVVGGAATGVLQAAAVPALFGLGTYKFGRFIFSPKVRVALGRTLKALEQSLPGLPPEQQLEVRSLIKEGNQIIRGDIPSSE